MKMNTPSLDFIYTRSQLLYKHLLLTGTLRQGPFEGMRRSCDLTRSGGGCLNIGY